MVIPEWKKGRQEMVLMKFLLSDINYFHCLRIVELLKETESGTKNIFGRYSSRRMKVRIQ